MERDPPRGRDMDGGPATSAGSVGRHERTLRALLAAVALGLLVARGVQTWVAWQTGNSLGHVSGAWTALAMDSAAGVLYRAPFSEELGYGGTQYFPLQIVLHGWLIRLLGDPILAGHAIAGFSSALLVTGIFAILRRAGQGVWSAIALALLVEASSATFQGLTSIRGDVLPTALTVWGLFLVARRFDGWRPYASSALFTAAFATKITAVQGVVAATLWLAWRREWRASIRLAVVTAMGFAGVFVITQIASDGRFLENLRACAGGGADWKSFATGPLRFLMFLPGDLGSTLLFVLAMAVILARRPLATAFPALAYFAVNLLIALVIFGLPGVGRNQFVDLAVTSLLVLGSATTVAAERSTRELGIAAAVMAGLIVLVGPSLLWAKGNLRGQREDRVRETSALVRKYGGSILADDPLVPVSVSERPYLLDAYMYRLLRLRMPSIEEPLLARVRRGDFRAIFLRLDDQGTPGQYRERLGPRFAADLSAQYVLAETTKRYEVYVRRAE